MLKTAVRSYPCEHPFGNSYWEVTISLEELGISVSGHGSQRAFAEEVAAVQFENILNAPENMAKLESLPRINITSGKAQSVVNAHCATVLQGPALHPDWTAAKDGLDGYKAQISFSGRPLGSPSAASLRSVAMDISSLVLAHQIVSGHPDLYPPGLENVFLPKVVVDDTLLARLGQFNKDAQAYLATQPPNSSPGAGFEDEDDSYIDQCLAGLPFPPSIARILILGVVTQCLEPAILFAALEMHAKAVADGLDTAAESSQKYRNPLQGDQRGYAFAFQTLRQAMRRGPEKEPLARGIFTKYSPGALRSIDAIARGIEEEILRSRLLKYRLPTDEAYQEVFGTGLYIRREPYGSWYSKNCTNYRVANHLLALAFHRNIAQCGYVTQLKGYEMDLRMDSRRVRDASPGRWTQTPTQLKARLTTYGPLIVFSGQIGGYDGVRGLIGDGREDIVARYFSPLSTLQAVLMGTTLSRGGSDRESGCLKVLVNDWLPVSVKSDARGLTDDDAMDLLFEARGLLRRAINKALADYFRYDWRDIQFYMLLRMLPPQVLVRHEPGSAADEDVQTRAE